MIGLSLGIFAAFCWSFHDLVARLFALRLGPFRMALLVMLAGAVVLLPPVLWQGRLLAAEGTGLWLALVMGVVYAVAVASLFKAFSLAPVSIVGPFTAGYPALIIFWHVFNGVEPAPGEWLALAFCLSGAIIVARTGPADGGLNLVTKGKAWVVVVCALSACVAFAATVIIGQAAAQSLGQYETTFISRMPAALALLPFAWRERGTDLSISRRAWGGIFVMAALDVAAVSAINAAGFFPGAAFSSIGISLYGAVSVLLAMLLLKERVALGQWFGIALIVAGIALLGWPKT